MFKNNSKFNNIKSSFKGLDVNKLYSIQNYILRSKDFFSLLELTINSVDTTSVDDLGDFYCDIKLLYYDFKKEVLDNDNFK